MEELEIIYDNLDNARCPEDIFGVGDPKITFKRLAKLCHPDRNKSDLASKTFARLSELKKDADARVKEGSWGKKIPFTRCLPIQVGAYKVRPTPIIGDICDIYIVDQQELVVKVSRHQDDNDLLGAEFQALTLLNKGISGPVSKGVPELKERFLVDGKRKREANVISSFPGFVSAVDVHQKKLVDTRTAVWMFKRILSLLTWVHHYGIVHGAILPPHVLFYPDNDGKTDRDERKHSIRLIDWCYSLNFKDRTRLSSWVPVWKTHYAPELLDKSFISPASDIYMAANLIGYLINDDHSTSNALNLPASLRSVLLKCTEPNHAKRYQKASDVLDDWTNAATKEFGSSRWHYFNLP